MSTPSAEPVTKTNAKSQSKQTQPKSTTHYQNDFGADLWIRQGTNPHRAPTAGRGLFAGLQDTKNYNVDSGWAKRSSGEEGLGSWLWNKYVYSL
ncbi:hypothetical protein BDV18DRAFT_146127 [Aspergillus unguis]